jgi:hypothetical protein
MAPFSISALRLSLLHEIFALSSALFELLAQQQKILLCDKLAVAESTHAPMF